MEPKAKKRKLSPTSIVQASDNDLENILGWLKEEYESNGETYGFWTNRNVIKHDHENGNLLCLKVGNKPIGMLTFETSDQCSPNILTVKESHRMRGYGSLLVQYCEGKAKKIGQPCLNITALWSSIGFWKKHGFSCCGGERYWDGDATTSSCEMTKVFSADTREVPKDNQQPLKIIAYYAFDRTNIHGTQEFNTVAAPTDQPNHYVLQKDFLVQLPTCGCGSHDTDPWVDVYLADKMVYQGRIKYLREYGMKRFPRGVFLLSQLDISCKNK